MPTRKHASTLSAAVLFAGLPLAAFAQTTTNPTTTLPNDRPAINEPSKVDPAVKPGDSASKTTAPTDKQTTVSKSKANPLIGLAVFSSDGSKVGTVHSVLAEPDGTVKSIHFKTGGFLGFGAKTVSVPDAKFTRSGDNIQLGLTADEVSKLPEARKTQS